MAYDFKPIEGKLIAAKEWLGREYRGLRTGRATPSILDGVTVTAYGSQMPLKQVGNVGIEDARTLRITPWDMALIKDIERGVVTANLGLGTVTDSSGIRVTFPELTSERREQLIKVAKQKLEEARTTVRVARDEAWKDIQEKEKSNEITEDDKFRLKDELQKKIDTCNDELEGLFDAKETEMNS
jgi:ribosome recycling factor